MYLQLKGPLQKEKFESWASPMTQQMLHTSRDEVHQQRKEETVAEEGKPLGTSGKPHKVIWKLFLLFCKFA